MSKSVWLRSGLHIFLASLLVSSVTYTYIWQQLIYKPLKLTEAVYTFEIAPGSTLKQFTQQLHQAGILAHPKLLNCLAILNGSANHIKAGEYTIGRGMTAKQLLKQVVAGQVTQYAFTIVEGWRTADLIAALQQHPKIEFSLNGLSEKEIINKLGISVNHLEGMFLPDTYYFTAHTKDVDFLRRAHFNLQEKLQAAWQQRAPDSMLSSPYQALILASIIEKESGVKTEYHEISGVFQRRLTKHMRLQADPTVIYALGDKYKGTILKSHLQLKSPYNTYVSNGLPPTPIAMPGLRAIEAALHPATGDSLYFVATGDGGHVFTKDLVAHNKAVQKLRDKK